jgi:hypothetical protein
MKTTNRLAFLWLLFAGLTIVPTSSLLHARNPEIGDEIIKEPGRITVPFTASVPEKEILDGLNKIIGDKIEIDENSVLELLKGQLRTITNLPLGVGEAAEKLIEPALGQIRLGIQVYNARRKEGIAQAAAKLKSAFDGLSPKCEFSSEYEYCEGMRNPGDPGWGDLEVDIPGLTRAAGSGAIALNINVSLELTPLGVGGAISFDVSLSLEASASGQLFVKQLTGPTPVNIPTATVGGTPGIDIEISGSAKAGTALSIEIGGVLQFNTSFRRITGTIVAGEIK